LAARSQKTRLPVRHRGIRTTLSHDADRPSQRENLEDARPETHQNLIYN
jgi:hypothetical protein